MVLKSVFLVVVCAALLTLSGPSAADQYRPDEYLGLDLSRAVLSPKPLGPAAEFAPVQVEVRAERGSDGTPARVAHVVNRKIHVAHVRAEKPRAAVPARLARRHGNPLDAQASISRVQVWPCRSGGICNWKR
jgi:hypothetical protein